MIASQSAPARSWDLSALPHAAADLAADAGLLDMLRRLRSVCVATWCWAIRDGQPRLTGPRGAIWTACASPDRMPAHSPGEGGQRDSLGPTGCPYHALGLPLR